jgi:hypothetical protein
VNKSQFKLPGTVGPWFTYWIEYIPEAELGKDRKRWFRAAIQSVLIGNPFGRKRLATITVGDLTVFLEESVYPKFDKQEAAMLRAYFHSAMVAARNLGGAEEYRVRNYFTKRQLFWRRTGFAAVALGLVFSLIVSALTLDRVVRKNENLLTASATVLRESGFGVAVAFAEDVYYTYLNPPSVGGTPTAAPNLNIRETLPELNIPTDASVANNPAWGVAKVPSEPPAALVSPVEPLDGEGEWASTRIRVNGNTAIRIAQIRPDDIHTSYWATVAWFDPKLLAFAQVPGTKIPEVEGLEGRTGRVPNELQPYYVAGLNGGFLMRDSQGGYSFEGKVYKRLIDGKASLVTYNDGSFDVVQWGRAP